MRFFYCFLALLMAVPFALAQLSEVDVVPPSLPAENEAPLILELHDLNSKALVSNIHARLTFTSNNKTFNTLKYIPEDGRLKLNLKPGNWKLKILIDDIASPGKDYIYETTLNIDKPKLEKIFLLPAGSIQGTVLINDGAVPLAKVILYCSGSEVDEAITDITGSFGFDWVPVGECKIVSVFKSKRGETDVKVTKGSLIQSNIVLTGSVVQNLKSFVYVVIIIMFFLLVLFFIFSKNKNKDVFRKESVKQKPSRIDDILRTLNSREKVIVNFLLENNNQSTQAIIKNKTNIPKTSLIRILNSLETKNIVSIERVGKMKKIKLKDWILGKT